MSPVPTLNIIGPGRVGKALGRVLHAAGMVSIHDVLGRTVQGATDAVQFIGAGRGIDDFSKLRPAGLTLLAVPDDAIEACCIRLARSGLQRGGVVFHCSGARGSAQLDAARTAGATVASVHPVRSFADPAWVAADFPGTFCGAEGDDAALAALAPLFEAVGARMVAIDAAQKTLYHAAAVFASNYLVTLIDVAVQTYGKAGIAPELALQMIAPLLRETAENTFRLGPAAALTGPVARGDVATVARQQQALAAWKPEHATLYADLARATAVLAATRHARADEPTVPARS